MQLELEDSWQDSQSTDIANNSVAICVDGEAYFVRGGKHIRIEQDPMLKHIRMQRRQQKYRNITKMISELHHMAPPFV